MNTFAFMWALSLTVTMCCAVPRATADRTSPLSPMLTIAADCLPEFDPSQPCRFRAFDAEFQVHASGLCKRVSGDGAPVEVCLPLARNSRIDRVLYAEFEDDLLLVYEVSDGESGWGTVVRLARRSLTLKWRLNLPSFNISLGTIENARLYQAGLGFVAAIDLRRGKFVWKHTGLYDQQRQSFNAFLRPDVIGPEVIFRENPIEDAAGSPRLIRVVKGTGKISLE